MNCGTRGVMLAPADVAVHNPAFDATPVENVTTAITEDGVVLVYPGESWGRLFPSNPVSVV